MSGLDPCTTLTSSQIGQLQIDDPRGLPTAADSSPDHEPTCSWVGVRPRASVYIEPFTALSLDTVDQRPSENKSRITVRGFPALQRSRPLRPNSAAVEVWIDVAENQSLQISYEIDGAPDAETARQRAMQAAEFAIDNLMSR